MEQNQQLSDTNAVQTENPIWDVAKLVMAFLIVGIHTGSFLPNATANFLIKEWASRSAVPLFFCLAGYFLFQKVESSPKLRASDAIFVRRCWLRFLRMYALWTCVYLILRIIEWTRKGVTVRDLLIYAEFVIVRGDSYLQLWFLSALCMAVFLLWMLHPFLRLRTIGVIALLLYLFGLIWLPHYYLVRGVVESSTILSAVFTFLNRFIGAPQNGVFFAFVFVTLGAMLAKGVIRPIRGKIAWFFVAASLALSLAEVWQIRRANVGVNPYYALQFSLLPLTYFWFSALNQIHIAPRPVYRKLRKCSTLIYCVHPLIIFLFNELDNDTFRVCMAVPFVKWVVVYALAFCVSLGWIALEKRGRFRFLRRMH